jgi:hypothetical protein
MQESTRSQLKAVLLIWGAATLAFIVGYFASLAITVYGFYEVVKAFSSDDPTFGSLGHMALGCGLQLLIVLLFFRIRDRFEHYCWQLVSGDAGTSISIALGSQVLVRQADGEANHLDEVRARQSRRLSKRLQVLIEQAWPDRAGD